MPPLYAPARLTTTQCADTVPVSAVMTTNVVTVLPGSSVRALAALLLDRHISGVVVVDERGSALGIASKTDLVRAQYEEATGRTARTVADIMMPIVFSLPAHASIGKAAALMAFEGVHRIPVVDDHEVIGIVSSLDILAWVGQNSGWLDPRACLSHPEL